MVAEALFNLVCDVLVWVLGLLPTWEPPLWLIGAGPGTLRGYAETAGSWVGPFGDWLPLDVFFVCALTTVTVFAIVLVARAVLFIARMVRG